MNEKPVKKIDTSYSQKKTIRQKVDDVVFMKQAPMHPRDKLKKKKTQDDYIHFLKQVPLHPRDRLKKKTRKLEPIHPRDKMKRLALQIAPENAETLLKGKFNFSP